MVEHDGRATSTGAMREVNAELSERRIARGFAIGLPLVTLGMASVFGIVIGPSMAILVLASGTLLGVIALFWTSLRILSGDAVLSPELEALDATAHAVDALSSRKRMLIRALKDLENERALGKLEDEDYEQLTTTYRAELKDVLRKIDASLEPHRPKAEEAARAYLVKAGLVEEGVYRGAGSRAEAARPAEDDEPASSPDVAALAARANRSGSTSKTSTKARAADRVDGTATDQQRERRVCARCGTSNDGDAGFCKKCGSSLDANVANAMAATTSSDEETELASVSSPSTTEPKR